MKFTRKQYANRGEKTGDFLVGFFGWFLVNGLLWCFLPAVLTPFLRDGSDGQPGIISSAMAVLFPFLPLILNLVGTVLLAFTRKFIAFGVVVAFVAAVLLTLLLAVAAFVVCASGYR